MKTVLVQVTKEYICLTACEPVKELTSKDNKKAISKDIIPFSFTSPYIMPIEQADLDEKNSIWECPKLFAEMVKNGLRQMKRTEVKEVIIMAEGYDLTCQEFQHIRANKKVINSLAISKIQEIVGDAISDFSVILTDYGVPKEANADITAKSYAVPKALIADLSEAFKDNLLNLVKVIPTEVALIGASQHSIYSFDKTVALISMDYAAVRIIIIKNGMPLYCHSFVSPLCELAHIISEDRQIALEEAIEFIRTTGYGLEEDCKNPTTERRIEDIKETAIEDIVRNLHVVLMSLNLELDQIYLSDFLGYMPRAVNYIRGFNMAKEVNVVSDSFNSQTVVPELSIQARDDFYKTGAFFVMNELMNCGTQFDNNLMIGLSAAKAKNIQAGKKMSVIGIAVLCSLMVIIGGAYGFLAVREGIDTATMAQTKYDTPKELLAKQAKLNKNLSSQEGDVALLPKEKLYMQDVLIQMNEQLVSKVKNFKGYNITHTRDEKTKLETVVIPVSGEVATFSDFLDVKNGISDNEYFKFAPSFTVSENTEKHMYSFTASLSTSQKADSSTTAEAAKEKATEAATKKN
ncbi:MAG TPA: hypothetical protein GX401_05820 [Clostridiales bacterium]|nr:hypothetical protein [Clostridiales bacterium]